MLITEEIQEIGHYHIRAYQSDSITVNDTIYTHSFILAPHRIIPQWTPQSLDDLKPEHLEPAIALTPKILLIGTGRKFRIPNLNQLEQAHQKKIGVEYMDTHAACRTYIALLSEGRSVVAALLIL